MRDRARVARLDCFARERLKRKVGLRRRIGRFGLVLALLGFAFLAWNLSTRLISETGGTGSAGADAFAYWLAGRRLIAGEPLYGSFVGGHGAYLYPPVTAQLISLVAWLPLPLFVWLWRTAELLSLRYVMGSWTLTGIALLVFPPLVAEIEAGNVNLLIAAAVAAGLRGKARAVAPSAIFKFSTMAALPAVLVRDRKGAAQGAGAAAILIAGSVLLAPDAWRMYIEFLQTAEDPRTQFYNVGRLVPTELRLAIGAFFAILAVRAPIVAPVAVTLASPVLWFHSLSTLVACWAGAERRSIQPRPTAESGAAVRSI